MKERNEKAIEIALPALGHGFLRMPCLELHVTMVTSHLVTMKTVVYTVNNYEWQSC